MSQHRYSKFTNQIANSLGVEPSQLVYFTECHPDPSPEHILNIADSPVDSDDIRSQIDEWLAEQSSNQPEETPGGDAKGLLFRRTGPE
jgi:hypothetical protein